MPMLASSKLFCIVLSSGATLIYSDTLFRSSYLAAYEDLSNTLMSVLSVQSTDSFLNEDINRFKQSIQ